MQNIIVFLVISLAVAYTLYAIYGTLFKKKSKCDGCTGCDLHNKIMQTRKQSTSKNTCDSKKCD